MSRMQFFIPCFSAKSNASISSMELRPNFEYSPPDSAHLPWPELISFIRSPIFGLMFISFATLSMISSSLRRSTTMKTFLPSFWLINASRMKVSSLYPLHTRRASGLSRIARIACNSGFEPASSPKL